MLTCFGHCPLGLGGGELLWLSTPFTGRRPMRRVGKGRGRQGTHLRECIGRVRNILFAL